MIFYAAGNFVFMSNMKKESEFRKLWNDAYGKDYNRLVSFYFKKESDVVMSVKDTELRYFCHSESESYFVLTDDAEIADALQEGRCDEISAKQFEAGRKAILNCHQLS